MFRPDKEAGDGLTLPRGLWESICPPGEGAVPLYRWGCQFPPLIICISKLKPITSTMAPINLKRAALRMT